MGLSNEFSCEAGNFSYHHNPHRFLQPEILRLYFPVLEPWVVQTFHSPVVPPRIWDCPLLRSLPCPVLSAPATHLHPTYRLVECFLFNSLVVGLPYSLIFWQLCLFFVFKFIVLLLVVQGTQVDLPMPPSWLETIFPHF